MSRLIEIYGLDETRRLDETSLPLSIGTHAQAHVRLEGEGGKLAYVGESRGHLFLQPAEGDHGQTLYHNDEAVAASVWLKSGDTIRCGDCIIRWLISGQRVEVRVSRTVDEILVPPAEPPEPVAASGDETRAESVHPVLDAPRSAAKRFRPVLFSLFFLLLVGVAFVLLAKPLLVTVTPVPDRMSVSGFPLVINLGDRYLGLPGSYVLRAEKRGYRPLEVAVQIAAGNSSYDFVFEELPGVVDLISHPPGATILVDGVPVAETPATAQEVAPGERLLRFEHPRYLPLEKSIVVAGGGARDRLEVTLKPAFATVLIRSEPAGAELQVDGKGRGVTPLELELLAGERKLAFRNPGFSTLEVDLEVAAGEELQPEVYRLEPAPAHFAITSIPSGATVSTDGQFRGQSPLTLTLQPGVEHRVRVSSAGYLPQVRKLKPAADEQGALEVKLEPEYGTVFIAAIPPDATLTIDGKKQKQATGRFRLPTRPHKIALQASGYERVTRKVTPQAGYSQRLEISLQPEGGVTGVATQATEASLSTGLGQKLVLIKPRPFLMGASRKEPGRRANEREHRVKMERSFYLSEREVTNREFRQFQSQHVSGVIGNRSLETGSHPVVNVRWEDAIRFLNWLSEKDGLPPFYVEQGDALRAPDPRGPGYRLPTEAEWAYAARMAGRKEPARYPWQGKYPPKKVVGNFADESARHLLPTVIEGYDDKHAATSPVGSFAANIAGLYDLGGNVAEWCHDYYTASPVVAGGAEVDPVGANSGTHHVVRGSSWSDASITELRYSYRRYSRDSANDIGFRIARYAR